MPCLWVELLELLRHAQPLSNSPATTTSTIMYASWRADQEMEGEQWCSWQKLQPAKHRWPPSKPTATFNCNSQISTLRGQSLFHFYRKIRQIEILWLKCKELDQNKSSTPNHKQIHLFSAEKSNPYLLFKHLFCVDRCLSISIILKWLHHAAVEKDCITLYNSVVVVILARPRCFVDLSY